ncbi:MAG: lyase family protein [Gammaproteobacteria bacterium]|nr:lyase family protein [Gammaproteobacteria bacterium]MDH3448746.1 lyase family protein [Gammaproteobacteria bacterium]
MAVSPFDSAIYRELLHDDEIGRLFTDDAEIQAMLRVEGALAKAQGALGIIPADSATAIERASAALQPDPASLAAGTGRAGIPIPALLETMREALKLPEFAQYVHWGATSQDVMDTGLMLRLRTVCDIVDARLRLLLQTLADHAEAHAELPMAARTRRQTATATSFGAVVAAWGAPLLDQLEALAQLRPRLLRVSLAGAAGNASALGAKAAATRSALARELELADTDLSWHSNRAALAELAALLTRINGALARMGEDCVLAAQDEVGELKLPQGAGSSTMPHKNNPITAETLVSLFQLSVALDGAMQQALLHRQQRDGAAWSLEWHALPQICMAAGRSLQLALALAARLAPDADRMLANLQGGNGLAFAEAVSFRLAAILPRAEAQARVRELCAEAIEQGCSLAELVSQRFPDIDWQPITDPGAQLGDAPRQARGFAARARNP